MGACSVAPPLPPAHLERARLGARVEEKDAAEGRRGAGRAGGGGVRGPAHPRRQEPPEREPVVADLAAGREGATGDGQLAGGGALTACA